MASGAYHNPLKEMIGKPWNPDDPTYIPGPRELEKMQPWLEDIKDYNIDKIEIVTGCKEEGTPHTPHSQRNLYAVVRKKVDNDMADKEPELLSIHEDETLAIDWAKFKCFEDHGHCFMYNTDGYLQSCNIISEPIFGPPPEYFRSSTVYFVRPLVHITSEHPVFPDSFTLHTIND